MKTFPLFPNSILTQDSGYVKKFFFYPILWLLQGLTVLTHMRLIFFLVLLIIITMTLAIRQVLLHQQELLASPLLKQCMVWVSLLLVRFLLMLQTWPLAREHIRLCPLVLLQHMTLLSLLHRTMSYLRT
jgi:hypothetical protein